MSVYSKKTYKFNISLTKTFIVFISIMFFQNNNAFSINNKYELNLKYDYSIIGASMCFATTSLLLRKNIKLFTKEEIIDLNSTTINFFDKSAINKWNTKLARASDYLLVMSVSSPIILLSNEKSRKDINIINIMYFENILLTTTLTYFTKHLTKRIRPFVYNNNVDLNIKRSHDTQLSFFSGHTSLAFSSAIFFSSVYSKYSNTKSSEIIVWSSSIALASTIGYLRYASGKHFPTDIISGAIIGSAVGYIIPKVHEIKKDNIKYSLCL